jgi:nucleotide-binding universal stress UspA family protein
VTSAILQSQAAPLTSAAASEPAAAQQASLVFATNGSAEADAALRFATALARRDDLFLHVLAVLEPLPSWPAAPGAGVPDVTIEIDGTEKILDWARKSASTLIPATAMNTSVLIGVPGTTIASAAREWCARYIILGAGHHGRLERLLAGDTVVRVMRHAAVPVIAVPASCGVLPRNAIAAIDFGNASVNAARSAADIVCAGALQLVHVRPEPGRQAADSSVWSDVYESGAELLLSRFAEELRKKYPDLRVETALLSGHPAEIILQLANSSAADFIAVGQHGSGTLERLLFGSVAHALIRGAQCPVLVAPPTSDSDQRGP